MGKTNAVYIYCELWNLYLEIIPPKLLVICGCVLPTCESILVVGENGLRDRSCDISITKPAIELSKLGIVTKTYDGWGFGIVKVTDAYHLSVFGTSRTRVNVLVSPSNGNSGGCVSWESYWVMAPLDPSMLPYSCTMSWKSITEVHAVKYEERTQNNQYAIWYECMSHTAHNI